MHPKELHPLLKDPNNWRRPVSDLVAMAESDGTLAWFRNDMATLLAYRLTLLGERNGPDLTEKEEREFLREEYDKVQEAKKLGLFSQSRKRQAARDDHDPNPGD